MLVARQLRSTAVLLSQMRTLIVEAHEAGHSHKVIHATLEAAGLRASWNTYKCCLRRMKKAAKAATSTDAYQTSVAPDASRPLETSSTPPSCTSGGRAHPTASATHVMDALRQAQAVANAKDYGQIARDRYRQQQREERERRLKQKEGLS